MWSSAKFSTFFHPFFGVKKGFLGLLPPTKIQRYQAFFLQLNVSATIVAIDSTAFHVEIVLRSKVIIENVLENPENFGLFRDRVFGQRAHCGKWSAWMVGMLHRTVRFLCRNVTFSERNQTVPRRSLAWPLLRTDPNTLFRIFCSSFLLRAPLVALPRTALSATYKLTRTSTFSLWCTLITTILRLSFSLSFP